MHKLVYTFFFLICFSLLKSQNQEIDHLKIQEDLDQILSDLSQSYSYFQEKNVDLDCLKAYYQSQISSINSIEGTILFFEYLMDEFYDSHLILNTNTSSSFRLYAPIYVAFKNNKFLVTDVWQSQLEQLEQDIIGAELLEFNGLPLGDAIDRFPIHCADKTDLKVREWIVNKLLAGRYNEPRLLSLKLENGERVEFNLDALRFKLNSGMLSAREENGIGIIRINNSLGNNDLIPEFDIALDNLMDTKGLIIDLRNTVDGGNSYVARGIMGRFINEPSPYQKHMRSEHYARHSVIERVWMEFVSPRGKVYQKPVIILVGRWTGSMGEGMAVGFEGMGRAAVVGTAMQRLAGEMYGFSFKHQQFGYRLSTAKLFHVNGTPRELYLPPNLVIQTTVKEDEILAQALRIIGGDN